MSAKPEIPVEEMTLPAGGRWPSVAMAAGGAALVALLLLGAGDPALAYRSYLVAFLYALSIALGGMFFVLLQFLTRAGWSVVVRRLAEHVMGTLPLFAALFVPVALGLHQLYPWADATAAATDPVLAHKASYLNGGAFLLRAAVILLSWAAISWWFRRRSIAQDTSGEVAITGRLRTRAAPAMVWFAISVALASFDWIMSLEPDWFSTIYGVYYFAGCVVGGLALIILLVLGLQSRGLLVRSLTAEHLHDLGKLLFGFTAFWAYIAFSQFLLLWYAHLPEETVWYAHRWRNGWQGLSVALAVGNFVIPFFFLLPEWVKRRKTTLRIAAGWLLVMHYLDIYWLVMPSFRPEEGLTFHPLSLLALVGVAGICLGWLGRLMRQSSLIAVGDPRLAESLAFENL